MALLPEPVVADGEHVWVRSSVGIATAAAGSIDAGGLMHRADTAMYAAKVLICELTFVAPDHRKDKIHKFGHMHLDDLAERRDRFKNELIIAAHLSTRYHASSVRAIVSRAIPDMLDGRLHLWL